MIIQHHPIVLGGGAYVGRRGVRNAARIRFGRRPLISALISPRRTSSVAAGLTAVHGCCRQQRVSFAWGGYPFLGAFHRCPDEELRPGNRRHEPFVSPCLSGSSGDAPGPALSARRNVRRSSTLNHEYAKCAHWVLTFVPSNRCHTDDRSERGIFVQQPSF